MPKPLFDRTRKGAIPTALGRVLLERGEAVLRSEADLRREIKLRAGLESGSLAISAGPLASETSVAAHGRSGDRKGGHPVRPSVQVPASPKGARMISQHLIGSYLA